MRYAPEGMTATAIALIVGHAPSAANTRTACNYVRHFPSHSPAMLRISAPRKMTKELLEIAEDRHLPCSFLLSPEQAIRMADMAVIVGNSPWSAAEIGIIEEQGIVVEWKGRYGSRGCPPPPIRQRLPA